MVRTQIQLTSSQSARLKKLASQRKKSVAEIIRAAVERELREAETGSREELVRRALAVIGRHSTGRNEISINHDDCFADSILP